MATLRARVKPVAAFVLILTSTISGPALAQRDEVAESPAGAGAAEQVLDGIYTGLAAGLHLSASGSVDRDVSATAVTFYPDGRVYRRVPEGGLEGWNAARAEALTPELWGRYRQTDPESWEIRWNESERTSVVTREGTGLKYEGGTVFPVATCEGLQLHGAYVQPGAVDSPYPAARVIFLQTGEFLDEGLIGDLAYLDIAMPNPRTIAPGQGRYRIGRNTLYLDYLDGRRVQVEIHAARDQIDQVPLREIFINGWRLRLIE